MQQNIFDYELLQHDNPPTYATRTRNLITMEHLALFKRITKKIQNPRYKHYLKLDNFNKEYDTRENTKKGLEKLEDERLIEEIREGSYKMLETEDVAKYQNALGISPKTRKIYKIGV